MGIIDKGAQKITFDFKEKAKGNTFNQILRGIVKPGIYEGQDLTIVSGNNIQMSPGNVWLNAEDLDNVLDNLAVKVETRGNISETINQTTAGQNEVVYWVYEYVEAVQNYADPFHTNYNNFFTSRPTNSVIIGEIVYDGGGNAISIDYTNRDWGSNIEEIADSQGIHSFDPVLKKDVTIKPGHTGLAVVDLDLTNASLDLTDGDLFLIGENDYQSQINGLDTRITQNEEDIFRNSLIINDLDGKIFYDNTHSATDLAVTGLSAGTWLVTVQVYSADGTGGTVIHEGGISGPTRGYVTLSNANGYVSGSAIINGDSFYIAIIANHQRWLVMWQQIL